MKSVVAPLIKFLFVIFLLSILIKKGIVSFDATVKTISKSRDLAVGCAFSFAAVLLGALRFHVLLRFQQIWIPFLRTLRLTLIGSFYNLGLPGSVTGDFVKGFYLAREAPDKKTEAFAAVLIDRLVGLLALIFISAFALTLNSFFGLNNAIFSLRVSVYALLIGSLFFIYCVFCLPEDGDLLFNTYRCLFVRIPRMKGLAEFYRNLKRYRHQPAAVLIPLLVSVCIHLVVCTANIFFLRALGLEFSARGDVFIVLPLAILSLSFPLLPLGLGTGHLAFWFLFHLVGIDQGANLYNLRLLCAVSVGILGGVMALKVPLINRPK